MHICIRSKKNAAAVNKINIFFRFSGGLCLEALEMYSSIQYLPLFILSIKNFADLLSKVSEAIS